MRAFLFNFMVGVKGLEPSTSRSQTARASQLRHTPIGEYLRDYIVKWLALLVSSNDIIRAMFRKLFHRHKEPSRSTDIAVVSVAAVTFVLSCMATIANSSIWFDEAFGAYIIRFNFAEIVQYTALDVHPPLYYFLLKLWSGLFGTSDIMLRSMSVFFGVVALILAFLVVKRLFGSKPAYVAIMLAAISPMLIRYGQEMRMYTLALAIAMAATYALVRANEHNRRKWWITYAVLIAAGMWTHYLLAIIWLAHWAWRAYETHSKRISSWFRAFFSKEWVGAHVFAVLLFVPWIPIVLDSAMNVQKTGFWIPAFDATTLPAYASEALFYETAEQTSPWLVLLSLVIGVSLLAMVIRVFAKFSKKERSGFMLLASLAVVPVVLLVLLSVPPLQSSFLNRYLLPAMLATILLAGIVLYYAPKKWAVWRVVIGALLAISFLIGISNVYRYGNFNTFDSQASGTRQLIEEIRTKDVVDQPIVVSSTPWHMYYEAAHYSRPDSNVYYIDEEFKQYNYGALAMMRSENIGKISDMNDFAKKHSVFWYVGRPGGENLQPPLQNLQQLEAIRMNDRVTGEPAYQAIQYRVTVE